MELKISQSRQILQRTLSVPLVGGSFSADELLDVLRRAVSKMREIDPEISNCNLHDVRFKFQPDGIEIIAEFNRNSYN